MKKIIYRKDPTKRFYLHMDETECEDLEKEMKKLQEENPTLEIILLDDTGSVFDFITKENLQGDTL
jgi:hypothetical protein